ncbi:hypothetical protein VT25_13105 [Photobacterium leiognathi subsp. mandapamensis]|nr:hypothetical protein VT25_13105 [Photobacterium leiognathi subsp. mandapamensis]
MCRITGKKKPHIKYGEMRITVTKKQAKAVLVFSSSTQHRHKFKKEGEALWLTSPRGCSYSVWLNGAYH